MRKILFTAMLLIALSVPRVAQASDLQISVVAPNSASQGTQIVFTYSILNSGPAVSSGSILITMPTGLTFQSMTAHGEWGCSTPSQGANGSITCTKTTFAATLAWQPSATLVLNEITYPTTPNGHAYKLTTVGGGVTDGTEPIWNTGSGSTTTDNGMTWTEVGADTFTLTLNVQSGLTWWSWLSNSATISAAVSSTSTPDDNMENDSCSTNVRITG